MTEYFRTFIYEYFVIPFSEEPVWMIVLLIGQSIFASRFLIQWIASEYKKRSHVPDIFWYLSLCGSGISLLYFLHVKNPILIIGYTLSSIIYIRNIHLIRVHAKQGRVTPIEYEED